MADQCFICLTYTELSAANIYRVFKFVTRILLVFFLSENVLINKKIVSKSRLEGAQAWDIRLQCFKQSSLYGYVDLGTRPGKTQIFMV